MEVEHNSMSIVKIQQRISGGMKNEFIFDILFTMLVAAGN